MVRHGEDHACFQRSLLAMPRPREKQFSCTHVCQGTIRAVWPMPMEAARPLSKRHSFEQAHSTMAPTVGGFVSAAVGAVAVHGLSLLACAPSFQAMWTWTASPPRGAGWSCEQAVVGCTSWLEVGCRNEEFDCAVVPDAGYTCNVTETTLSCAPMDNMTEPYKGAIGIYNYCQDKSSILGGPANSALFWSPEPSCTKGGNFAQAGAKAPARPHTPAAATEESVHDGVHFIQKPPVQIPEL